MFKISCHISPPTSHLHLPFFQTDPQMHHIFKESIVKKKRMSGLDKEKNTVVYCYITISRYLEINPYYLLST